MQHEERIAVLECEVEELRAQIARCSAADDSLGESIQHACEAMAELTALIARQREEITTRRLTIIDGEDRAAGGVTVIDGAARFCSIDREGKARSFGL
ncbi:MAG: hypothetical protein SYC29_07240 [Planctomycetota bacterium]|nr:hypothetical protein [Planctomycetota bacterium]